MGMFDDLIEEARGAPETERSVASAPRSTGLFDDLIAETKQGGGAAAAARPISSSPYGTLAPIENETGDGVLATGLRQKADQEILEQAGPVAGSPWYTALTSAANTGLLNLPRNVGAAVRSVKTGRPFGEEYEYIKAVDEAAARRDPWTAGVYGVGGALAGAAAIPVAPAASLPGRMAQGAGIGAMFSGGSELLDSKDPGRAAQEAAKGAAFGAVAPAVIEGAGNLAVGAKDAVLNRMRPIFAPDDEAGRRVASALGRDIAVGGQQLDDAAFAAAQARGQPVVLADLGGSTTKSLARAARNTSPEAEESLGRVVSDRFESQAPRVAEFVHGLGVTGQDAFTTREALKAAAAKMNRPAYARAFSEGANGVWGDELAALTRAPVIADAIKGATRTGANKAVAQGFKPVSNPFAIDDAGNVALRTNAVPTLQFWDAVKRNLDDTIGKLQRSGEKSAAADAIALKNQLVGSLDAAAPSYAAARAGAARFFGAEDALEAGQKFVTARGSNAEARAAWAKLSEPEKKLFADGFASELAAKINETGDRRSVLNTIFNSPNARQRVEIALGKQKAKDFEAFLHVESAMDRLRNAVTGNSSTVKQLADLGLAGGIGGAAGYSSTGDPKDILTGAVIGAALRRGAKVAGQRIDQKVMQRVGEMLASSDPQIYQRAIKIAANNKPILELIKNLGIRGGQAAIEATDAVTGGEKRQQ